MTLSERLAQQRQQKVKKQAKREAKKPLRMTFNLHGATLSFTTMMVKHSVAEHDSDASGVLMGVCYSAIAGLTGTETSPPWLDDEGFIRLIEMNYFAFSLGSRLYQFGTDATKDAIRPSQFIFETAAEAMQTIGERKNAKGVYRATGDELKALREAFTWLESLMDVSTQGHVLSALIEAKQGVKAFLQK